MTRFTTFKQRLFLRVVFLLGLSQVTLGHADNADLLEQFGIEIFEIDSERQAEVQNQRRLEEEAKLPSHIDPDTLRADITLDQIDLERPATPTWQAIEAEQTLTGADSRECCLKALRATRYQVEQTCESRDHEIWQIESIAVTSQQIPLQTHRLCAVYHNEVLIKKNKSAPLALVKTAEQTLENDLESAEEPDFYQCTARSQAKCFDPTGVNAQFVSE